jgi:hypothetical protein
VIYFPNTSQYVNGLYNSGQNKRHTVKWTSRYGGSYCGPVMTDGAATYPGGDSWAPDFQGMDLVTYTVFATQYRAMLSSTRRQGTTVRNLLYLPVPPGASGIGTISVWHQVVASTLVSATSNVALFYDPLNGGATNSVVRGGIAGNDGTPNATLSMVGNAAPTAGHFVLIELRQTLGGGEPVTPSGPLTVAWFRLSIVWS